MKTASQRFSNVMKEGINPILKENGFKKKGSNYFKSMGEIGHTVNIQKDRWNSKDDIKFTINLGIFSEKYWLNVFDFEKTEEIPLFPKEVESVVRKRVSELKYDRDSWYGIEAQKLEWSLIKEVKGDIEKYALPFFDELDTTEKLIDYLKLNQKITGNDSKLSILIAK